MKTIQLQINRPLEMSISFFRYIHRDHFQEQIAELNYIITDEIVRWVEEVDQQISPFLRNDLMLFGQMKRLFGVIVHIIFTNQLTTPEELLQTLESMSPTLFLQYYLQVFEQDWNGQDPIDYDQFAAILQEHYDDANVTFIVQSLQYPAEFKDKLATSLRIFYQQFFQPIEEQTIATLETKIQHHHQLFEENPELFSRTILLFDLDELQRLDGKNHLQIYASYFDEFTVHYYDISPKEHVLIYSTSLELRYNKEIMAEKQKLLFKILSDEKRVEILKLLAQREWYGNELAKHFHLTTATMSYHLSKLLDLGLIHATSGDQNRFYYRLRKDQLIELFLNALQDITGEKIKL